MRYCQCLSLLLTFGCIIFQDASGVAKVKISADENLNDPGTYIVHFENNATTAQLQHFTKQLIRRSNRRVKFETKIISELPNIKCLTVRLSHRALKWVRIISYIQTLTNNKYYTYIVCLLPKKKLAFYPLTIHSNIVYVLYKVISLCIITCRLCITNWFWKYRKINL